MVDKKSNLESPKHTITLRTDLIQALTKIQSEFLANGERINYDYALRVLLSRDGNDKYLEVIHNE